MSLDICLVGFGAIGALYACALERSSKARVTAVCRSNYETIREHGLEIVSDRLGKIPSWKPHRVVRTVAEAADRPYTFIVCAMKCVPEVIKTTHILRPLLQKLSDSPATAIVLLQNGIGIEDDFLEWLDRHNLGNNVISGCAWVDTTAVNEGKTVTQSGSERLVLGYHRPAPSLVNLTGKFSEDIAKKQLDLLCTLLRDGSTNPEPVTDIDAARWHKILWNASFSTLCTLTRATVGDVLAVDSARTSLADIMLEVLSVAHASLSPSSSATLPDSVRFDIIRHENPKSVFKPSMLVDLEAGRPMEVEAIVGGVLKRARAVGVQVPRLELIYAGLSVLQKDLLRRRNAQS
ncbi:unnamed protein product [Somion occarium]|uniref:2-dehydropantoate 2-reductase n=1 Tax=Somion occarium TaxID=3059160 RepID=A0ABP1E0U8_9APHY